MKSQPEGYQPIELAVMEVKEQLERLLERHLPEPVRMAVCPLGGKLNRARMMLAFAAFGGLIRAQQFKLPVEWSYCT